MPAAHELLTATGTEEGFCGGTGRFSFFGEDVSGALKGCAADVDVAAGGLCEDEGDPCRGAGWVA